MTQLTWELKRSNLANSKVNLLSSGRGCERQKSCGGTPWSSTISASGRPWAGGHGAHGDQHDHGGDDGRRAGRCLYHCIEHSISWMNEPSNWARCEENNAKSTTDPRVEFISYTNLDQISSESRPSINFKILTKHQHLHKTETSKSWLMPTHFSAPTVTTSRSIELASSHVRVTSIKFNKQQLVSK